MTEEPPPPNIDPEAIHRRYKAINDGLAASDHKWAVPHIHDLKSWPQHFRHLAIGAKTFECRNNDRGFQCGDILMLREWIPGCDQLEDDKGRFTGEWLMRTVTHILEGGQFGIAEGWVVMSLSDKLPDSGFEL